MVGRKNNKAIILILSLLLLSGCSNFSDDSPIPDFIDYGKPRINDTFEFIDNETGEVMNYPQPPVNYSFNSNTTIGAWNVQVFGQSKANNDIVFDKIVDVIQDYDLIAIQEVRDLSGTVESKLVQALVNTGEYDMYASERLGRTKSKEQILLIYNPRKVSIGNNRVYPDADDFFERPPLVSHVKIGTYDFSLIVIHVKPDDAQQEIQRLEYVVDWVIKENNDRDVIIMGDLNGDKPYYSGDFNGYEIKITDDMDTNVARGVKTYDRVLSVEPTPFLDCDVDKFEDDTTDEDLIKAISDHFIPRCVIV